MERSLATTADQRLYFLNSSHIQGKIEDGPKLRSLFQGGPSTRMRGGRRERDEKREKATRASNRRRNAPDPKETSSDQVAKTLYLSILSRFPTQEELRTVAEYAEEASSKREAAIDLAWALINSPEFLYRH